LTRTPDVWDTSTISTAVGALMARVDAGQSMTLVDVNTALAVVEADLTGVAASSNSVGTLAELLSVLAGRAYEIPRAAVKFVAAVAPDEAHIWSPTLAGGFTVADTVFDSQMYGGEWGPSTSTTGLTLAGEPIPDRVLKYGRELNTTVIGGDVVNNEIGAARATFDGTHFQASVQNGQLARFAQGITLFPDQDVQAHVAQFLSTKQVRQATLLNQRIVTVYDDDGTLLA